MALDRDFALAADYFFVNAVPIFNVAGPTPAFTAVLDFSGAPSFRDDNGTDVDVRDGVVFLTAGRGGFDNGSYGDSGLHIGRYLDAQGLDNGLPSVSLTAPADGAAVLERRQVTARAEATDDDRVEVVEFLVDGAVARRDFTAPYEHVFAAPPGGAQLTLGARVLDRGGNVGLADEVTLEIVPDDAPTVRFLGPLPGSSFTEGTTIPVAVLASDDVAVSSVELSADGVSQGILPAPPFRFDVPVPLGATQLTLSAVAVDDAEQTTSAGPLVVAIEDDSAPFVAIVEPPAGAEAVAGGGMRVVVGAADDLGVEQVRLRVDGTVVALDSEPPYEFEIEVPLGAGELVLAAEAEDALDQVGISEEASVEVVPDPLTTVFGRVLGPAGQPVADAEVATAGGLTGVTGADGFFSIPDAPTVLGDLVVHASAEPGGVTLVGVSAPAAPVAGDGTEEWRRRAGSDLVSMDRDV